MNVETIKALKQVIAELKLPGPIKPGLRKRLNEIRVQLLEWYNSEIQRDPPQVRMKVNKKGDLVETKQKLPGVLIRSPETEALESLIQVIVGGCVQQPPREVIKGSGIEWTKASFTAALEQLCDHFEDDRTTTATDCNSMDRFETVFHQAYMNDPNVTNNQVGFLYFKSLTPQERNEQIQHYGSTDEASKQLGRKCERLRKKLGISKSRAEKLR